jgi:hypothetical protein
VIERLQIVRDVPRSLAVMHIVAMRNPVLENESNMFFVRSMRFIFKYVA